MAALIIYILPVFRSRGVTFPKREVSGRFGIQRVTQQNPCRCERGIR